ncbi:MAG: hypothetical protein ABI743_09855 [bacterium]
MDGSVAAIVIEAPPVSVPPRRPIVWPLLVDICSPRNPYLVHEINVIRRDMNFWRTAAIYLLAFWLFFFQLPLLIDVLGRWVAQEGFALLTLVMASLLLVHRLRRPHNRYHGENAVFLCLVPIDGARLVLYQAVGVLYQPLLLMLVGLPLAAMVVRVGMVQPYILGLKFAIIAILLMLGALCGVGRTNHMIIVLGGLPIGLALALMIGGPVITVITGIARSFAPMIYPTPAGVSDAAIQQATMLQEQFTVAIGGLAGLLYLTIAAPIVLFLAALNPILSWLTQTTDLIRTLQASPGGNWVTNPSATLQSIFGQIGGASGMPPWLSSGLSAVTHGFDALVHVLLFSPWNWAVLGGLAFVYGRDAWLRGSDQFEYFRVRGYPERLREYRILERTRLMTRNSRVFSERYWGWGEGIRQRWGTSAFGNFAAGFVALTTRPFGSRAARRAMTMHPIDFQAREEARWNQRAVARHRRTTAPAMRPRVAGPATLPAGPAQRPQAAPLPPAPQNVPLPPMPAASPFPTPGPVSATVATPGAMPLAAPVPLPPAPPLPMGPGFAPSPAAAVAPLPVARVAPGPPRWLAWLLKLPSRALHGFTNMVFLVIPRSLRDNIILQRDLGIVRAIMSGDREGIWSYSWTVLLTLLVLLSTFIYFLATTMMALATVGGYVLGSLYGSSNLELDSFFEALISYLGVFIAAAPYVMLALPIYGYLKERGRPDWSIYALTGQSASNLLLGKWMFFLVMATAGMLLMMALGIICNPMVILAPVLAFVLGPIASVSYSPALVEPVSLVLFILLLLGLGAFYYQVSQLLYFFGLCCIVRRPGAMRAGSGIVLLVLGLVILAALIAKGELYDLADWFATIATRIPAPLRAAWVATSDAFADLVNTCFSALFSLSVRQMPLLPHALMQWFWSKDTSDIVALWHMQVPLEAYLFTLSGYWGIALLLHRIASGFFESRLRGEVPRYFTIWPRRRHQAAPAPVVQSRAS